MESNPIQKTDTPLVTAVTRKSNLRLPLIALGLDILPLVFIPVNSLIGGAAVQFMLIFISIAPIVGLMIGITSLSRGKKRLGTAGKVISLIAVILPLAMVAFLIIFFVGAAAGIISLM